MILNIRVITRMKILVCSLTTEVGKCQCHWLTMLESFAESLPYSQIMWFRSPSLENLKNHCTQYTWGFLSYGWNNYWAVFSVVCIEDVHGKEHSHTKPMQSTFLLMEIFLVVLAGHVHARLINGCISLHLIWLLPMISAVNVVYKCCLLSV